MAITDWMPTLTAKLGTITGLAASGSQPHRVRDYTDLPGTLLEPPTAIVLPLQGRVSRDSASAPTIWVHELIFTIYMPTLAMPEANAQLIPFIKRVSDVMAANTSLGGLSWSGGRVDHWLPLPDAPFYEGPGVVRYGGQEHMGLIFHMELKENETGVTVTA